MDIQVYSLNVMQNVGYESIEKLLRSSLQKLTLQKNMAMVC